MRARGPLAAAAVLLLAAGFGATVRAESPAPAQAQEEAATADTATDDTAAADEKKLPFALYVEVGYGTVDAKDLDVQFFTDSSHEANNLFSLDGLQSSKAAIGWKMPFDKGDFRLTYNGTKEDGYELQANGKLRALGLTSASVITENLTWFNVAVANGMMVTRRNPPEWTPADDTNMSGSVEQNEVVYDPMLQTTTSKPVADDLQNRTQTWDVTYGRTFGGRRFNGRWWAGGRYFLYDGHIPLSAWLTTQVTGYGYTEGQFLPLLNVRQEARALGPVGSLEAHFNFFDERLQLYLLGEASFVVLRAKLDTGPFITLADEVQPDGSTVVTPIQARLNTTRDKSTWQDRAEAGARLRLRNGVTFEFAYTVTGYLDARFVPIEMRVPESPQEAEQGTSGLFLTRDIVLTGWRAGVSFQF